MMRNNFGNPPEGSPSGDALGPIPPDVTGCWRRSGKAILYTFLLLVSRSSNAETYEVGVFDFFFEPFELSIRTGDTVFWTAYGYGHSVIADNAVFDSFVIWNSSIPALKAFRHTFHQPGDYPYHCGEHGGIEGQGMSAVLHVSGSVSNQLPYAPTNAAPTNSATQQLTEAHLQAGPFLDGDAGDFHRSSQWIVRRISDNQIAYDSGEVFDDNANSDSKTNRLLPANLLNHADTYRWQVRYRDSFGGWGDYSTPTSFSTQAPALRMSNQGSAFLLMWPTNAFGFSLQSTADLSPTNWSPVDSPPRILGGQNVVTNRSLGGISLFRLSKP